MFLAVTRFDVRFGDDSCHRLAPSCADHGLARPLNLIGQSPEILTGRLSHGLRMGRSVREALLGDVTLDLDLSLPIAGLRDVV